MKMTFGLFFVVAAVALCNTLIGLGGGTAGEPVAVSLDGVDIGLAIEEMYEAADYLRCDDYEALKRTWKDARRLPTRQELRDRWDARVARAQREAAARRARKRAFMNRLRSLGVTAAELRGLLELIEDASED